MSYKKKICRLCKKTFTPLVPSEAYCCNKCNKTARKKQNRDAARRFRKK